MLHSAVPGRKHGVDRAFRGRVSDVGSPLESASCRAVAWTTPGSNSAIGQEVGEK